MKHLSRIFKYIWPQWQRISIVLISVVLISFFFMLSYATISPLLTVMMGSEGLHGWLDRKISQDRYDINFYVPDSTDFMDPDSKAAYQLKINNIEEESVLFEEGIRAQDWITGVNDYMPTDSNVVPIIKLLEELATIEKNEPLIIQYRRTIPNKTEVEIKQAELRAPEKPFFADFGQELLAAVPREQSKESKMNAVIFVLALMVVVTILRCFFRFLQDYTAAKIVQSTLAEVRMQMFGHSMDMQAGFFVKEGSSDTVSRMIRDSDAAGKGINVLLGKAIREPVKAIGLLIFAFYTAPQLTLIFITCVPFTLVAVGKLGKKIKRATRKSLQSWSLMLSRLEEAIGSVKIVKVYNRQEAEKKSFDQLNKGLLKQLLKIAKAGASTSPVMESLAMIAASTGLVFGVYWVSRGDMEPADFFTLLIILGATAESFRRVSDLWPRIQESNAAAERVFAMIDQPKEPESKTPVQLKRLENEIQFNNIYFTYPGNEHPTLKDINLTIKAGSKVALVGPNGSGKTTLASLLPRFYDPDSGIITIDGVDIKQASLYSLRDQISLVTQNTMTFSNTIAYNIAYSKEDATMDEIIDAAKQAFAHEFITQLPNGYETMLGQAGAGLSGGQLQRIAIARAMLKNPEILIFDEATSQIDAESEAKIHTAVERFMQDRTSIVIAHRFSTIMKADMIVVFDNGRVRSIGTHHELTKNCALYNSLYETQLIQA